MDINDLLHVANAIWVGADTPVALGCFLRAKYGEWRQLAEMATVPSDYTTPDSFKIDNQCTGFLRKCKDLPTGVDLRAAALANFREAEELCCHTNAYFSRFLKNQGPFEDPKDEKRLEIISRVRKEIAQMIGKPPTSLKFRLGPGSTLSDPGVWCTIPHKFCSEPTITPSALHVLPLWAQTAWARNLEREVVIRLVDYDKWTSVDKDALKERGISTQPSINVAAQLAVGRLFRLRLRRRGIDLDMLQLIHRRKACEASLSGAAATIDLRNASDTEARKLIQLLFSHEWFFLLDSLRVPFSIIRSSTGVDERLYLQKFSGMGNGYTFELETIVFLAICRVVCGNGDDVSVYGDDIIVPSEKAALVVKALRFFGFQPNLKKTCIVGPFRESCGGDYFLGVAVRPHFQDEAPTSPQGWISLANGLRRVWCDESHTFDPRLLRAWHLCLGFIPSDIRACRGPSYLGDIVIHDSPDRWQTRSKDSIRYFRAWLPYTFKVFGWSRFPAGTVLSSALYGVSNEKFGIRVKEGRRTAATHLAGVIPRDGVTGFRRAWVPFS
jgi:hypothetical protein